LKLPSPNGKFADWRESGVLDVSSPGDMQFTCQSLDRTEYRYFNLSVTLEDAYLFLTLEEQKPEEAIIKLQNHTPYDLQVSQFSTTGHDYLVRPQEMIPFAWNEPCKGNKLSVKVLDKDKDSGMIVCSIESINELIVESFELNSKLLFLTYKVVLQGSSRVVHFYTDDRKSIIDKREEEKTLVFHFRAELESVGISFISAATKKKYELAYVCMAPVSFILNDYEINNEFQLRIGIFMVDNNMESTLYPVMMFPVSSNKEGPFLDIVCNLNNKERESDVTSTLSSYRRSYM
jgi:hypothetical protein